MEGKTKKKQGPVPVDLTGKVFGAWTVLRIGEKRGRMLTWVCRCECGKEKEIYAVALTQQKNYGCLECSLKKRKLKTLEPGLAAKRVVFCSYKADAERRGKSFLLSFDEFIVLSQKNCFYCGVEPSNQRKMSTGDFIYNGVDRRDNNKDYTTENSVPCCGVCNRAKGTMSYEDFLKWCEKAYYQTRSSLEYKSPIRIEVQTIPHTEQGPSKICAQWYWDENGIVQVRVSKLGNLDMERLLIMHEVSEVLASAHDSDMDDISTDKIDQEFLELRNTGKLPADLVEPGFYKKSPYRWAHHFATASELALATHLHVDWIEYQRRLDEVSFEGKVFDF